MHRTYFVSASIVALALVFTACDRPSSTGAPGASASSVAAVPAGAPVKIGLELVDPQPIGALQVDVEYKGEGRFVGDADGVACETKIEGALSSYNHIVADKVLKAAFVAVKGFAGPIRFSECSYEGPVAASDFRVTVRDASSPELVEIDPAPAVKVVVD